MDITIDNFENYVGFKVLARGLAYYEEGAVQNLEEVDDGEWTAEVEGSEIYEVEVTIDKDENITWDCDCPYDYGPMCKHVVAVLMAIREERKKVKNSAFSKKSKQKATTAKAMKEEAEDAVIISETVTEPSEFNRLMALVKVDELKLFVRSYAESHPVFKEELSAYIRGIYVKAPTAKSKDYRKAVIKAFGHVSRGGRGRYDYDGMSDWDAIFNDIDKLFEEARLLLKSGNAEAALAIGTQFLLSMNAEFDESLIYNDDIDVTEYCEEAERFIMEAIGHKSISVAQKQETIKELKTISPHSCMCNYYDFDIDDLLLRLTMTTQSDEKALELLDENIKKHTDDYDLYTFVLRKIVLLRKMNREAEAKQVTADYLYLPEIRRQVVEDAISEKRFDEAIRLITDGIAIAQKDKHPGTERGWMERLLQIYERQQDIPAQVTLCRQLFIFENGSMKYYQKLKSLIAKDEWKAYLQQLIDETDMRDGWFGHSTLADIYVEEHDWERLFDYVHSATRNILDTLDEYSHHLRESHSPQLLQQYTDAIKDYAAKNVGRTHYERIGKAMFCMQRLNGGKAATAQLAAEFRILYKNRPAMRETLSRF